jgi:hypothetical protein
VSDYLTTHSDSSSLQTLVASKDFVTNLEVSSSSLTFTLVNCLPYLSFVSMQVCMLWQSNTSPLILSSYYLLQGMLTGSDAEEQLLAASVVTNMAAGGSPELCEAALNTAPHLIQFLDSQNLALVDQSAWALGNIAADGPKFRDRLKDNGALAPLIKLLDSKVFIYRSLDIA